MAMNRTSHHKQKAHLVGLLGFMEQQGAARAADAKSYGNCAGKNIQDFSEEKRGKKTLCENIFFKGELLVFSKFYCKVLTLIFKLPWGNLYYYHHHYY